MLESSSRLAAQKFERLQVIEGYFSRMRRMWFARLP